MTNNDTTQETTDVSRLIIPEQFDIMITTNCNAECPFCVQEATYRPDNVDDDTFMQGLTHHFDSFYSLGGRRVVMTGGEPTLNIPRLLRVLRLLKSYRDLEVNALYTNGSRLLQQLNYTGSETVAEGLKTAGLNWVNLTVHDYNEEHKRQIYKLDNAPETQEITKLLTSCGLSFRFNLTLHKKGIETYVQFVKYVRWAFDLGAKDIYVRNLFRYGFDQPLCVSTRNSIGFSFQHRIDVEQLLDEMRKDRKMFAFQGEKKEQFRDKRECWFEHRETGRYVYIARLVVGTEDRNQLPYLVYMPDGCLYKGWLGEQDRITEIPGR